jgi:hypothetical protein
MDSIDNMGIVTLTPVQRWQYTIRGNDNRAQRHPVLSLRKGGECIQSSGWQTFCIIFLCVWGNTDLDDGIQIIPGDARLANGTRG